MIFVDTRDQKTAKTILTHANGGRTVNQQGTVESPESEGVKENNLAQFASDICDTYWLAAPSPKSLKIQRAAFVL